MTVEEFYKKIGGDYQSILERLGSPELIRRFIIKFLDDPNYKELEEAFENGDVERAFISAHTLKGVAINLAFKSLFISSYNLVERLRLKTFDGTEDLFLKVKDAYKETTDAIKELAKD